jgi:membrane protease YdiL (CAAX protease family)
MSILKAFLATIFFIIVISVSTFWMLMIDFPIEFYYYSSFLNSVVECVLVLFFVGVIIKSRLIPTKTSVLYYVIAIILGPLFVFFQTVLNYQYNYFFETDIIAVYNLEFENILSLRVIGSVFFIPIAEEFFFRHYIQRKLQANYRPIISILITSFLFSILHLPFEFLLFEHVDFNFYTIHQSYIVFFGSLILGAIYFKSKSIGPPLVMHIMWNLCVYIL